MEMINSRRSIRKYKDTLLTKEQIEQIIQAGIEAPSAKNRQPWEFVVVQGKKKEELVNAMERGIKKELGGMV